MADKNNYTFIADPFKLNRVLWPDVYFYEHQRRIIRSVEENKITVVPAANMMGKDFVAGNIAVNCFLRHPVCRIVTTSVRDDHLRVLWGEMGRFIQTSKYPLLQEKGGILRVNHQDIRKYGRPFREKQECKISYLRGMVSEKGEGMAGHHAPFTLGIIDEASGVDDLVLTQMETWAKRILIIGNCNPTTNFFYRFVKAGDVLAKEDYDIPA